MDPPAGERVVALAQRLKELRDQNMLKINHSVLELVVAKSLIVRGYEVDLECTVEDKLVCDICARKGMGTMIVEIETGYVPPSHALDPSDYINARVASKIARYSNYCDKFVLGSPPHYILPIPECLVRPPRSRTEGEIKVIKEYCDVYYSNPPVSREEILNARIHSVFIIDVDSMFVTETDPVDYMNRCRQWRV